jgi:hypothetical protein
VAAGVGGCDALLVDRQSPDFKRRSIFVADIKAASRAWCKRT